METDWSKIKIGTKVRYTKEFKDYMSTFFMNWCDRWKDYEILTVKEVEIKENIPGVGLKFEERSDGLGHRINYDGTPLGKNFPYSPFYPRAVFEIVEVG